MIPLLLASKSLARKALLRQANIPFVTIEQSADETKCDWGLSFSKVVENIALYKMEHAILPPDINATTCLILTADTLLQTKDGVYFGKPKNKDDARRMLQKVRSGATFATSFCLDKKLYKSGKWQTNKRITGYADAQCVFHVPEEWINVYFDSSLALVASGAVTIEGYGLQFLQYIQGSYSAVVGLPLYELRQALTTMGFFRP